MKDIHEIKNNQPLSFNHVRCRGLAASVHLVYSMDWKLGWKGARPQQHHRVSKKFASPQTMPIVRWSTPKGTQWRPTTSPPQPHNPLPVWMEQVHLHRINLSHTKSLSSSQTVPALPPGSSTSLTGWTGLEGLCQANGGGVVKGQRSHRERAPTSTGPASNAQHQKARPNLRLQSQHQLAHTCTAHRWLCTNELGWRARTTTKWKGAWPEEVMHVKILRAEW